MDEGERRREKEREGERTRKKEREGERTREKERMSWWVKEEKGWQNEERVQNHGKRGKDVK